MTRLLNSIPKEDFLQNFQDMYSRFQRCIAMVDDYFERHSGTVGEKEGTLKKKDKRGEYISGWERKRDLFGDKQSGVASLEWALFRSSLETFASGRLT
ncbi:hypothetical protein TNCV_2115521 [Trichonephila clavipes]|nr:hypothetical protein TNCV_2115521 [Trichonephila clavipes]